MKLIERLLQRAKTDTAAPAAQAAPLLMALEPRVMFDGAIAATLADTLDAPSSSNSQDQTGAQDADSHTDNLAAAPSGTADNRKEVVFVDSQVKDYQQLLSGLKAGSEVLVLDANQDGLKQIADYLKDRTDIDAIHLFGHGDVGKVQLGTLWLGNGNLASNRALLASIGQSLSDDADILLYGCDVGMGASGAAFVQLLAEYTGADIAASNNATGTVAMGGDWKLEVSHGAIETQVLQPSSYDGLLATILTEDFSTNHTGGGIPILGVNASFQGTSFYLDGTAGGGVNIWHGKLGANGPTLSSALGLVGPGVFSMRPTHEIALYGLTVNNTYGTSEVTVSGYLDGVLVETRSVAAGDSRPLIFSGFIVDDVRVSSNTNQLNTFIDDFRFSNDLPTTIRSATYNATTGVLVVTATGMTAGDDIGVDKFTMTGEGASSYTLTSQNVKASSGTSFTITLNAVDKAAINQIFNRNGTTSTGETSFNLSAQEGWNITQPSLADLTGNRITVSNVPVPTISESTYNAATGVLVVTGSGFTRFVGPNNDIIASKLTFTGQDGRTYTLTTNNVEITSGTSFTLTLNAADRSALNSLFNKNGEYSSGGTTYNLAAAEDWLAGANPAVVIADLTGNKVTVSNVNAAPGIVNLNGDSVGWAGEGNTVMLDRNGNALLSDIEFGALNSGNGNWAGATLTVQRPGTAIAADVFGFSLDTAAFTISGNTLQTGGLTFATFTITGGVLSINFTSSGTPATTALVNDVVQHISYRNDTPAGDTTVRFSLNDGSSTTTADVVVTSDIIYVTNTTDTATLDVSNGVSFSEAVAIAAADATGSQTIKFASYLAGQTLNISNVTINESLTINADAAPGLSINGGTITIGDSNTLTFTNSSGTVSILSGLAGSGSLDKSGAGTLVLGSTSNEAGMSGGITVSGGTLQVGSDDALSSGTLTLRSGGTLANDSSSFIIDNAIVLGVGGGVFNVVGGSGATQLGLTGVISGSGTLTKSGQSILSLAGSNTYTGETYVTAGTVIAGNAAAFGTTAGATTVSSGAAIRITSGLTIAENFTIAGIGNQVGGLDYGVLHLSGGNSTLSGSVTLTGVSYITSVSGSNLTLSGALNGSSMLNKADVGTLTLTGGTNDATFSGGLSVSTGTLSISSDAQLSTGTLTLGGGTLLITGATTIDNAILVNGNSTISTTANATLSGTISGTSTLTKTGASTLTLSGTNTHSGDINLTAGGLTLSGGEAVGNGSGVILSSGTTLTIANAETIGSLAGAGSVVLNAGLTSGGSNTNTTFSGVLSGAGGLTKTGGGTLTLTGNNTFTGATSVSAGDLTLNRVGGALNDNSAVSVSSGATLTISSSETIGSLAGAGSVVLNAGLTAGGNNINTTFSGVLSGAGGLTKIGSGALTLNGSNSNQSWGTSVLGGTLSIASTYNIASGSVILNNGTLAVTGNTDLANGILLEGGGGTILVTSGSAVSLYGNIIGSHGLTKTGAGALAIKYTTAENLTGDINVNAGTLQLDARVVGAITVGSGSTLTGTGGVIDGNLSVSSGGTLAPGGTGGVGTLTVLNDLTLAAGSTLDVQINGTTAGTEYDQVIVDGGASISGARLSVTHGYAAVHGHAYRFIDSRSTSATNGTFSDLAEGGTFMATGNNTQLNVSYSGGDGNDLILTAAVAPRVTSVSSSAANGTYKIDDTIFIRVTFDTLVDVTGTPKLQLETGVNDRTLDYVSGTGSQTLVFSYTVKEGDSSADLDYVGSTALTLNGGSIKGSTQLDANLTLPAPGGAGSLGANHNLVIDGVRPTVANVSAPANATYISGQSLDFTVNFSETMTVNTVAGIPRIAVTLDTGGTLYAQYLSGGGTSALVFRMTILSGQLDSNGITLGTSIDVNGGAITDSAGNTTVTTLNNVASMSGVLVDAIAPSVVSVVTPTDGNYKAGDVLSFAVNASEVVQVGTLDPRLVLDVGGATRYASYVSGSGSATLVFQYIVQAGDNDSDGITVNSLDLRGEPLTDPAGNDIDPALGISSLPGVLVDTSAPTASNIVRVDSSPNNSSAVSFTVTFSEDVIGVDVGDFTLIPSSASVSGSIASVTRVDGRTYTVLVDNLAGAGSLQLDLNVSGTGIVDAAGNALNGGLSGASYSIDRVAPSVTRVDVPSNGTYVAGQNLDFTVHLDEAVQLNTSNGSPQLEVTLANGEKAYATFISGSGTNALLFRLTVLSGQLDSDGIQLSSALDLNGATLRDAVGNDANLALNNVGDTTGVQVDAVAPQVSGLTLPADGIYKAGDVLSFIINASEKVNVDTSTGAPRLVLNIGGVTRYADYVAGSGSTALVFQYSIQAGNNASAGIALAGSIDLNGATVRDAAGNNMNLQFIAQGLGEGVLVDTLAPQASDIVRVDVTPTNASSVSYIVTFSESVTGVDSADFNLFLTGTASARIFSVTRIDAFTYQVLVDNLSGIGDLRLDLNASNTGILDAAGNLISGGLTGSTYSIDRVAPTVSSVSVPASGSYVAGSVLDFTVNTDEAVLVDSSNGSPRLLITLGNGEVAYANYLSGSGTQALTFRLTVSSGMLSHNGFSIASSIDTQGATLRDAQGNDINPALNNVGNTQSILLDARAPVPVSMVINGPVLASDRTLNFTLTFDESVSGVDVSDFSVLGSDSASGKVQSVQQIDGKTYQIVVGELRGQGTLTLNLNAANSGIQDAFGNQLLQSAAGQHSLQTQDVGDLQFRTNPPATPGLVQAPLLQPQVPGLVINDSISPLAPSSLFEVRTVGGDLRPLGTIFLGQAASAPSFIAQVFGSSDSGLGSRGDGFLSFGGGTGGIFGASTFASVFGREVPGVSELNVFSGTEWKQSDLTQGLRGVFGIPTLGQQLEQLNESDERHVRALAQALAQPTQIGSQA